MSKTSTKQKVEQLKEWMKTLKNQPNSTSTTNSRQRISKADAYKNTRR